MKRSITLITLALSLLTVSANAALTFYTDRSSWQSAVGTSTTESFNFVSPYWLSEGVNNTGLLNIQLIGLAAQSQWNAIDDGTGFHSMDGSPFYQGGSNVNNGENIISGADFIDIHLPDPVMAFGADFVSTHSGGGLTLSVDGVEYEFGDLLPDGVGTGFLGFISTEPFLTVRLYDNQKRETFGLDNVSFTLTPEPGTLVLFVLGAAAVLRKWK